MNLRKFCFILTVIVSTILFLSGAGILYYVNAFVPKNTDPFGLSGNSLDSIFQPLVQSKEPFNVLLLGGDKVNKNSDAIILANVDPETMKINIMSIPRDTKVIIKNRERKINYAFPSGGIDLAVKSVAKLLDVNIRYYVFLDTAAFREIIDLLGGVDYYIPVNLDYDDPTQNLHIHLKKGQQTLNGAKAEQFVRFRKPNKWTSELKKYYDGSDLKRSEAQQDFIRELMKQKLNLRYLPKLTNVIDAIFDNMDTNLTIGQMLKMTGFINKFKIENVSFMSLPGTTLDTSPWYFLCDVKKTRQIMSESFSSADAPMAVPGSDQ